jgi:hypothetical protein
MRFRIDNSLLRSWRQRHFATFVVVVGSFFGMLAPAWADPPVVLGDLDSLNAQKLTKEQLDELMPGAKISRKIPTTGSTNYWTNDPDGTLIASTDNKSGIGSSIMNRGGATAPGKWNVTPDGRYCLHIEWKGVPNEDSCRFVFKTSEGYFGAKTGASPTEKVYRLWINGI